VRRLLGHLGHPDGILRSVETVERGGVQVELVAQYDYEIAQFSHAQPCRAGRLCCHGIHGRVVASGKAWALRPASEGTAKQTSYAGWMQERIMTQRAGPIIETSRPGFDAVKLT